MIAAVALIGLVLANAAPLVAAPPAIPPSFFGTHRERFLAKLPAGSIAVFHAAAETTVETSPDPYRQSSDFWYLTGLSEPESVCVLIPASGGSAARFLLFVRPRDFAAEQWTGRRAGIEGAKKDFGAEAYPIAELWQRLTALAASGRTEAQAQAAQSLYYESGGDEA